MILESTLVLVLLVGGGVGTTDQEYSAPATTPNVVIDGYTVSSTLDCTGTTTSTPWPSLITSTPWPSPTTNTLSSTTSTPSPTTSTPSPTTSTPSPSTSTPSPTTSTPSPTTSTPSPTTSTPSPTTSTPWPSPTTSRPILTTPNVVIDGYTVNSTLNSTATLPLGTTVILVCRHSGIPHGLQTNYHWTCPNGPCQQTGYAGRNINNNILAINITSTSDGGTYICTVNAEGREASQQFQLNVNGGQVVHSYGRLILNERVITDKQQLQPPNNDSGVGRIECRVSSGGAMFSYHGRTVSTDTHQIISGSTATVVIRDRAFNNFVNFEGNCAGIYHYLFLSNGNLPDVSITGTTSTGTSISVNIGTIHNIGRVIIGYHRLDLGVPVVGEYGNNGRVSSRTFSSLVPGAKYRITAWGLGGGGDRRRSQSPAVREVTTMERTPSRPRHLTITRVCDDGIELNWIPPRETNGYIRHYIIKYTTQYGTQEINTTNNVNYYNLTRLERGQTYYNIRVVAVNSAGGGRRSQLITSYVHNSTVESTKSSEMPTPSPTTSTPSPTTSTPSPTTSTPSPTTSTPSPTTSTPSPTTSTPSPTTSTPTDVSCPPPSLLPNTMVLTTLTTTVPPGTTITMGCVDGYYTHREEILTCGSDGQWRGSITQCRGTCTASNLTAAFHEISYTVPTEIRPGTVVGAHLGEGHQVAISAVCQDDRSWRVQEQCVQSTTSQNSPIAVIIAVTVVNILILLVGIILLVIGVMLIVKRKRKRHTPTVQYDQESKVRIYDEVGDPAKTSKDTKVYQELDVNKMDDTKQYATTK